MARFDETFDWVVVGSGAGSMISALVMREATKSVLILEKSAWVGGTTAKSGGVIWVPNNRFMRQAGAEDSTEAAIAYLDAVVGDDPDAPGTSHERRLAYVTHSPGMVEFLVGQGIKLERASDFWPDYYDELPGGCKTSRCVTAEPFNKVELGPWEARLRQGFVEVPARLEEGMQLAHFKQSWRAKAVVLKIALRVILAKITGKHIVSAGAALQGRMLRASLTAGVDIRPESPVSELVVENGKVVGVVTSKDGQPWRVGARTGVLVNAGGFAKNQTMRDRYQPGTRAEWSNVIESDTGDMHLELERIGGVLAQMGEMVGYPMTRAPGWRDAYLQPSVQSLTGKPHAILVDQSGVRYLAEGGSYELYCEAMLKRNRTVPAVPSWAIFDARYLQDYQLAGTWPGRRKPKSWSEQGYLKKADTIEGLARLIKVDPAVLKATIERWNGFVDKGVDEDFHRGERAYDLWLGDPFFEGKNKSMGRIDKAPFYAVDVVPGDVGTFGGVVTDVHSRVVRADGAPIEGLYATGASTASVMGGVYPASGASIGPAMTFAYLAARHALSRGGQGSDTSK